MSDPVELKYQGPIQGAFVIAAPTSGKVYEISGRGAQFLAEADDVAWFTTPTRYGEEYVVIERLGILAVEPIVLPPVDFGGSDAVESSLPDVRAMTERQAKKAVAAIDNVLDLNVIAAVERATRQRPDVLAAIATRQKELGA